MSEAPIATARPDWRAALREALICGGFLGAGLVLVHLLGWQMPGGVIGIAAQVALFSGTVFGWLWLPNRHDLWRLTRRNVQNDRQRVALPLADLMPVSISPLLGSVVLRTPTRQIRIRSLPAARDFAEQIETARQAAKGAT